MSEVLEPYKHFDAHDLAKQLTALTAANAEQLTRRNILGPLVRYGGSADEALRNVTRAQSTISNISHYAVVNRAGNVVGSASIYPGLHLKRLRVPLPPALAPEPLLARGYPDLKMNVQAWVDKKQTEGLLPDAYQGLAWYARRQLPEPSWKQTTWTIESQNSPPAVHEAIAAAGLRDVGTGRFDDQETRRQVPPLSTLYIY